MMFSSWLAALHASPRGLEDCVMCLAGNDSQGRTVYRELQDRGGPRTVPSSCIYTAGKGCVEESVGALLGVRPEDVCLEGCLPFPF